MPRNRFATVLRDVLRFLSTVNLSAEMWHAQIFQFKFKLIQKFKRNLVVSRIILQKKTSSVKNKELQTLLQTTNQE